MTRDEKLSQIKTLLIEYNNETEKILTNLDDAILMIAKFMQYHEDFLKTRFINRDPEMPDVAGRSGWSVLSAAMCHLSREYMNVSCSRNLTLRSNNTWKEGR